jgi:hypothetical protein
MPIVLVLTLILLSPIYSWGEDEFLVITNDKAIHFDESLFEHNFTELTVSLNKQMMNLEDNKDPKMKWALSQIDIGLGTKGKVGIGLFEFGLGFRQRFIYVRK